MVVISHWTPTRKYAFDVIVVSVLAVAILTVLAFCAMAILVCDGCPIFYVSKRRVYRQFSISIAKFRNMRRDTERVLNSETVPITSTCFLGIYSDSPLYMPVGRFIERFMLTDLPKIYYVLRGQMSLAGNRPLPENVIAALREQHPDVERRFMIPSGLTGLVQLVGRESISDADRLRLEIAYCRIVAESYSRGLDILILFDTVVVGLTPSRRFTAEQVLALMNNINTGVEPWRPVRLS